LQHIGVVRIQQQQVRRADQGEVALVGVDKEPFAIGADGEGEVVGHSLVHAQTRGPAECGCHVDTFGLMRGLAHLGFDLWGRYGNTPLPNVAGMQMRANRFLCGGVAVMIQMRRVTHHVAASRCDGR
jgi:hypothetical protein